MSSADYHYDTEADCFVVTDSNGNELCHTASPHMAEDKFIAVAIVDAVNDGRLIFPNPGDTSTPQCLTK